MTAETTLPAAPALAEAAAAATAAAQEPAPMKPLLDPDEDCAPAAPQPGQTPEPAAAPAGQTTAAAAPWFDLNTFVERLARLRAASGAAPTRPRDPDWQRPQRQLEQQIRREAAAWAASLRAGGARAGQAAALLGVSGRTLRDWHSLPDGARPAALLGRPRCRCSDEAAAGVIGYLHAQGPQAGLPSLRATFGALPRVVLQDLLDCYRHLWLSNHPRELIELHWLQPGAVWGMDFTKVSHPIDERYAYAFTVRDLASGLQLLWRAVADETAQTVVQELELLFLIHGAPLVLKSDNGSAFRAGQLKALLRVWQVWPLYSPPGKPWYNGAVEASIGSLKTRTQFEAWRHGREDVWTSADLEEARQHANETARAPLAEWEARRVPSLAERERFGAEVRRVEQAVRQDKGIALDAELEHYEQAALHRRVLESVLVQHGLLLTTRRRIPQRIFGRKAASFR
jgi:transposase InsO family protein